MQCTVILFSFLFSILKKSFFFFCFLFYLCATYSAPNSQIRSNTTAWLSVLLCVSVVCVTFFREPSACLLPSGLFALEALCTAVDPEFSFTTVLGVLDWPVYWIASLLVSSFFWGRHIAQLLLEKEECVWCNFLEIWHVCKYHLVSPHIWLIQNLKWEISFPESFGVPASFSSASNFAIVGCVSDSGYFICDFFWEGCSGGAFRVFYF